MSVQADDFHEYLKQPLLFPTEFKDWVSDWFAVNVPKLHVSQIFGFKLQSIKSADEIMPLESTASTTYTNLATIGPQILNIPNGFYVVLFGARTTNYAATTPARYMSVSIDGAPATDADAAVLLAYDGGRSLLVDLTGGDNDHSLVAKYRVASGTNSWEQRWMHAIKVVSD